MFFSVTSNWESFKGRLKHLVELEVPSLTPCHFGKHVKTLSTSHYWKFLSRKLCPFLPVSTRDDHPNSQSLREKLPSQGGLSPSISHSRFDLHQSVTGKFTSSRVCPSISPKDRQFLVGGFNKKNHPDFWEMI